MCLFSRQNGSKLDTSEPSIQAQAGAVLLDIFSNCADNNNGQYEHLHNTAPHI